MSRLGQSLPHDSAVEHVRGEAAYIDDQPSRYGELIVDFVGSPLAHGTITGIDVTATRQVPRIAVILSADEVPENSTGPVCHDEEVLAKETVHYIGQPIVAIAGESRAAVEAAKKLVKIHFDPRPAVLTIEAAIAAKQFIGPTRKIARGDVVKALSESEHRLAGEFVIGGQEHFYLESQAAIAVPGESGAIVVHSSTQNPTEIQSVVGRALKLPLSKVVCICQRMGGGFGGKETQAALPAILAALVASKTRRPARMVLGHEQDFGSTGKRHPYLARYEVGFNREGRITALKTEFYSNGGFSADLSLAVMERTLLHGENAYFIPDVEFTGTVCRTNLPSNTAFRGFGGPQGVAAMENVIEEIAAHLKLDAFHVRRLNLYAADQATPYGQIVCHNPLPAILDRLAMTSDYESHRTAMAAFNANSKTYVKGLALTPVKFGISFTRRTLNQGNALVNVFLDGTVQVSTGGTEMGQGLNIKIAQLVASRLGIGTHTVRIMATSTEKNNNTSPTAASAGTDINGSAAVNAANQIRERLAAVAAKHFALDNLEASPECVDFTDGFAFDRRDPSRRIAFAKLVQDAYERRVDLGARGFFATPGVDFNRETGRGTPFKYFTCGAAFAVVNVDRFTGEMNVERVDLLMDLGRMINPAIDRGQVIGGFVQGMGWVTTEALIYDDKGHLLSDSATTYKIPNVTDVPANFKLDWFDGSEDANAVCGGKAVGEPPLLLAIAVWAAAKNAIANAAPGRRPTFDLPATGEEMLRRLTEIRRHVEPEQDHLDDAERVRPPVASVPSTAVV